MIKKKLGQVNRLVKDIVAFEEIKKNKPEQTPKAVLVSIKHHTIYHRFFYLLLKFYKLSGYNVYYPMDFATFRNIRNKERYLGMIVREDNFLIVNKKYKPENYIELKDEMFSPDYFSAYFENGNQKGNTFHIPMSFHPLMYHYGIWNRPVDIYKKRINSLFCYGNFDSQAYLEIKRTEFSVVPRTELLSYFKSKSDFVAIPGKSEMLKAIEEESLKGKYAFAIKENFELPMEDVRETLSHFNFYFCCPGVVMPLCHNVIEAMSVGTIPLIQKEYAEVMYPNLTDGENAIIFDDLQHLDSILSNLFETPESEVSRMRANVLQYFQNYLTPESMIEHLNESLRNKELVYLQAEHRTVKFVR
ncbi:glycosyltransferase [Chryseobacterium sp. Mn2064]|uniref:glycosyltransferase n=1 Tax=Chryseobacterium sp. Mn2064 TaxID=3395263 RepID=UPI003BDDBA45